MRGALLLLVSLLPGCLLGWRGPVAHTAPEGTLVIRETELEVEPPELAPALALGPLLLYLEEESASGEVVNGWLARGLDGQLDPPAQDPCELVADLGGASPKVGGVYDFGPSTLTTRLLFPDAPAEVDLQQSYVTSQFDYQTKTPLYFQLWGELDVGSLTEDESEAFCESLELPCSECRLDEQRLCVDLVLSAEDITGRVDEEHPIDVEADPSTDCLAR